MVSYVVTRRGADKVALFYTDENIRHLENVKRDFVEDRIPVIECKVNPWAFEEILAQILVVVSDHMDYEFEFHASCGTRVMSAAIQMAALLTESPVLFVEMKPGQELGEIIEITPSSLDTLSSRKRNLLESILELGGTGITQKDLIKEMEIERAGVSKHLKELRQAKFIEIVDERRPRKYGITYLGRVILSIKMFRKMTIWNAIEKDSNVRVL
jgi:CRISPR locus-related DNA-binding protein